MRAACIVLVMMGRLRKEDRSPDKAPVGVGRLQNSLAAKRLLGAFEPLGAQRERRSSTLGMHTGKLQVGTVLHSGGALGVPHMFECPRDMYLPVPRQLGLFMDRRGLKLQLM